MVEFFISLFALTFVGGVVWIFVDDYKKHLSRMAARKRTWDQFWSIKSVENLLGVHRQTHHLLSSFKPNPGVCFDIQNKRQKSITNCLIVSMDENVVRVLRTRGDQNDIVEIDRTDFETWANFHIVEVRGSMV